MSTGEEKLACCQPEVVSFVKVTEAKFVPVIRTFAPFMAGVARMQYSRFALFNVIGGLTWVLAATLGGYYLGAIPFVRRHFEKIVLGIVVVSVAPLILQVLRARATSARQSS